MTQIPLMKYVKRRLIHSITSIPLVCLVLFSLVTSGCSRGFWRQNADDEVYSTIGERLNDPRWQLPRINITPDPDSRFSDPYDPDCGPLPPDDPYANTYMHCVDGMRGSKSWHKMGQSFSIENPHWLMRYGLTPEMMNNSTGDYTGRLPELKNLTLADCVELSQINSRELQTQLEDTYLTALDVTWERFQFNVRYLGSTNSPGTEPGGSLTDTIVPHGPGDQLGMNGSFGMSRLLPAGGQIAAELANNTIWLFSTPNSVNTQSTLSYSIIQPLFAGAGRKVVLENLTQAERDLLYQARTLARFRQTLFTNVVSEGSANYLNLIQQIQVIRNQEQNIERLRNQVAMMQSNASQRSETIRAELASMPEGLVIPEILTGKLRYSAHDQELQWVARSITDEEEVALLRLAQDPAVQTNDQFQVAIKDLVQNVKVTSTPLDVLQLQGNLASSINSLRVQERTLQDSLDSFKLILGMPTDLILTIDDRMLTPFQVIDPRLKTLETEVTDYIQIWADFDDDNPTTEQLEVTSSSLAVLLKQVEEMGFSILDEDVLKLKSKLTARLESIELPEDRIRVQSDINRDLLLLEDARSQLRNLQRQVQILHDRIGTSEELAAGEAAVPPVVEKDPMAPQVPDKEDLMPVEQKRRKDLLTDFKKVHEDLLRVTRSLTVVEIGVRVEQIEIPDFEMPQEQVVEVAVENRVDLMNEKARVTDMRRKVEIQGNLLMGNVDVVVQGDIRTPNTGANPVNFVGSNSEIRTGLRFTTPLDQIDERNNYRTALINYQRERRNYMALEDQVKQQVRRNWRQLSVQRRNLETSRLQLRLAARQYESAVDESMATVQVGASSRSGVQGTNLIQALNSVVSAQNSLIQNWVTYEQNRLGIYRDMGIMEIGPDGIWNDSQYRKFADQDAQEELPGRQSLPDAEPDDGTEEAVPISDNNDGLGLSRPVRCGRCRVC